MSLLTIAQIDTIVKQDGLGSLTTDQLSDAHDAVLFARDPSHLGEEPHLRHDVDACGLDDDRLVDIESIIWIESDARRRAPTLQPLRMAA